MSLEELVSPASAALVIVDMQNDYCHPEGAQAAIGADVSLAAPMAARLETLLAYARAARVRTVFVRTHHSPWTNTDVWLNRGSRRHKETSVRLCLPGTWGAEFYAGIQPRQSPDWEPAEHDYVVTKHRYSGFVGTDLELVLRAQGITSVIMTGTASDGCVEATARDAFMRDFAVVFVSDCTVATTGDKHQALLQRIGSVATVVAADQIAALWQRAATPQRAAAGVR